MVRAVSYCEKYFHLLRILFARTQVKLVRLPMLLAVSLILLTGCKGCIELEHSGEVQVSVDGQLDVRVYATVEQAIEVGGHVSVTALGLTGVELQR